jgi:uncharacterized protein (DUF736 family)
MADEKAPLLKVTGLWKSEDRNGNMVLSGNLNGNARIVIFANTHKEAENQPDFNMYVTKNEKSEQ